MSCGNGCGNGTGCNDVDNFIIETVKKVDKTQKAVLIEESDCIACDTSLISKKYDTIPVSFFGSCGEPFKAFLEPDGPKTTLFRIESVRECRFVTLRLLKVKEKCVDGVIKKKIKCTDMTCILDLSCCCCMQCFEPINCGKC